GRADRLGRIGIGLRDAASCDEGASRRHLTPADDLAVGIGQDGAGLATEHEVGREGAVAITPLGPRVALGIAGVIPEPTKTRGPPRKVSERVVIEEREVVVEERGSELARGQRRHDSGAVADFTRTSGIASSSNTFFRSSIGVREEMSSSTFLRPLILPMRIAPTSLSARKKSRL